MLHAIIMAGGKGTRFWPASRSKLAKQFLPIIGEKSLLQQTINRLDSIIDTSNIWIVGNQEQQDLLTSQAPMIPKDQILLEPTGKNTAPCVGWAAVECLKKDPNATMLILPSDHYIIEKENFAKTIQEAVKCVESKNKLLTIGIKPTFPHTGYGYIEAESKEEHISNLKNFKEKPDFKTAQSYLESGNYYWNSGMFIWQANTILELFKTHLPTHYSILKKIKSIPANTKALNTIFHTFESISIDYGILEKASEQTMVIQSNFSWSDIGSWSALDEFLDKDDQNNASNTKTIALNSQNNIIHTQNKPVALIDIQDTILVETNDMILVAPKKSDQKIKDLQTIIPEEYL